MLHPNGVVLACIVHDIARARLAHAFYARKKRLIPSIPVVPIRRTIIMTRV